LTPDRDPTRPSTDPGDSRKTTPENNTQRPLDNRAPTQVRPVPRAQGLVGEPIWFDWTEGHPFLFGEKFVAALEVAHVRLRNTSRRGPGKDFLEYRADEHTHFLDAHHRVYAD